VEAIRVEIVAAAYNFLAERLEPEQNDVITKMKKMLLANCLNEFVEGGPGASANMFFQEKKDYSQTEHVNSGIVYLLLYLKCLQTPMLAAQCQFRLRQMLCISNGTVRKVLGSCCSFGTTLNADGKDCFSSQHHS
jgi:hypothetical protein